MLTARPFFKSYDRQSENWKIWNGALEESWWYSVQKGSLKTWTAGERIVFEIFDKGSEGAEVIQNFISLEKLWISLAEVILSTFPHIFFIIILLYEDKLCNRPLFLQRQIIVTLCNQTFPPWPKKEWAEQMIFRFF
jgi:hypothetical protein